jgi:large conductance mechanosensitive channel
MIFFYINQIRKENKHMWKEFKQFALKGNVLDLAIGVIIGGAFGKIVTSLVNDLIMPILGLLLGGVDLSERQLPIGDSIIKYGAFLQSVVDFLIISFSIFLFIRFLSKFKKKEVQEIVVEVKPKPVPEPSKEELLLAEIRDLLKKKSE